MVKQLLASPLVLRAALVNMPSCHHSLLVRSKRRYQVREQTSIASRLFRSSASNSSASSIRSACMWQATQAPVASTGTTSGRRTNVLSSDRLARILLSCDNRSSSSLACAADT
jgi:hypothetical protein